MSDSNISGNPEPSPGHPTATANHPLFNRLIFGIFAWIIVGLCFIYGVRMWFNSPLQPGFIPITGAAFCAALSFTLVRTLELAAGPIKIKFSGVEFEGASGPIILWCLCFFVMAYGLYILGLADVAKAGAGGDLRSLMDLFRGVEPAR
jgi:hypothetical protein